jgi:peptide/nickel transport system substrate-binding protein
MISINRIAAPIALVGVFALLAASCSFGSDPTTTTTSTTTTTVATTTTTASTTTTTTEPLPQHPYGGEAVIADRDEPPTLNRFLPIGEYKPIVSLLAQAYAAGVQDVDATTLLLVPELVTELPTVANGGVVVNPDGTMTINLNIRDEAMWEDGTPITGADFQFTFDTIMNPEYPITRTTYDLIELTEFGDKTFSYRLSVPTVQYESLFDEIIPKHAVEGTDFIADWNDKRWPSNGPFKLDTWEKGVSITLTRNPNYWKSDPETDQQLPYLDSVTWRFIPDMNDIFEAFKDKTLDVINPDSDTDFIEALKELEGDGAVVEVLPGHVWEHLNFQFGEGRIFRNPSSCTDQYEMRLAIAQTIDRDILAAEILGGHLGPISSYIEPFSPVISGDAWDQYTVDNVAAQENYLKAVAASGIECTVVFTATENIPDRVRMSELLAEMFAASGIPFESDLEDAQLFYGETLSGGLWDVSAWAWQSGPGLDPLIAHHDVYDPAGALPTGSNYYNWGTEGSSVIDESTSEFEAIRQAMNSTYDEDELLDLISQAEKILADDLVIIPLYAHGVTAAVWADEIGNFKHNPTSAGYPWNIEFWYRADVTP